MGAEDQTSAIGNSCRRVGGRRPAVPGMRPRSRSSRNASKGRCSARRVLSERSLGELVEPSGGDILFQLPIPMRSIELCEPATELFKVGRGKSFDGTFDLLEFAHDRTLVDRGILRAASELRLPAAVVRRPVCRKSGEETELPHLAGTAEIGMSPVDSATGRDVPHTRLRAIVATPSGSTAMGWTPPPDIAGIDVPKWECHQPLESRGASR